MRKILLRLNTYLRNLKVYPISRNNIDFIYENKN